MASIRGLARIMHFCELHTEVEMWTENTSELLPRKTVRSKGTMNHSPKLVHIGSVVEEREYANIWTDRWTV